MNIPQYPPEVRERALQLVEEGNSYSRVVQKLRDEFGEKYPEVEKISKSTIYRWVSQKKKKEKEEQKTAEELPSQEPVVEKKEEMPAPPKTTGDGLPPQLKDIPKIHPDQVVADLNREVTEVPPGPLVEEKEVRVEEKPKKPGVLETIRSLNFLKSKLFWSITATLVVGALILWITKRYSKHEDNEEVEEEREKPAPKKTEDYLEVKADEEEDEAVSALDLPF